VWSCLPVPAFGNPSGKRVKVATIGLNPALNEFQIRGTWKPAELRLPILNDYHKQTREELIETNIEKATKRRENYFTDLQRSPHGYFESLDSVLGRVNHLWSFALGSAVHFDLVACSTQKKWGDLDTESRKTLVTNCRPHFLRTLSELPSGTLLLLNGSSVCDELFRFGSVSFDVGPELILIEPQIFGRRGLITIGKRQFAFRGWNFPVNRLTQLQRLELVIWLRGHSSQ
jgi:hypothetical protein